MLKQLVKELCVSWTKLALADQGKYLGSFIGPGGIERSWRKQVEKFRRAIDHWSSLRLGFFMNTISWNIYCITLLEYVAQIMLLNLIVEEDVHRAMRKMAPGPGTWFTPCDLAYLKQFGSTQEMRMLNCGTRTSKLRIGMAIAKDCFEKHLVLAV